MEHFKDLHPILIQSSMKVDIDFMEAPLIKPRRRNKSSLCLSLISVIIFLQTANASHGLDNT